MKKKDIELVINVLKLTVDKNEELIGNELGLSKMIIDNLRDESSACCKAIRLLEDIKENLD